MTKQCAPDARSPESAPLSAAVDRLATEVAALRQVIDEIRQDFSWLTRNGLPLQPVEHVHVKRIALEPCAVDWDERLVTERTTTPTRDAMTPLESIDLDRFADDLKTTIDTVAQGQLEFVLTAIDGVRGELLAAFKRRGSDASAISLKAAASHESPPKPMPEPRRERPPDGRLF